MSSDGDGDDDDGAFYRFGRRSARDDRSIKSSKLPRAIKELEEEDPIDDQDLLDGPGSGAHKTFHGTQGAECIMSAAATPDGEWLPTNAHGDRTGVHLTFKVHGGLVAKQFSITAKVSGSNVSKLHQSKLQFFLGLGGQIADFAYSKKTFEDSKNVFGRATTAYLIGWTTFGGYGTGLEVAEDYDREAVATFIRMESLALGVLTQKTSIVLMVADVPGLFNELQAIQAEVIKYRIPWFPYLDGRGVPACSWAAFPKRIDVKADCGGLVPIPAQNAFTTIREAYLILANGICLEYRVSPKNDPRAAWPYSEEDQTYLKTQLVPSTTCGRMRLAQAGGQEGHGECYSWDCHQKEALRASRNLRGRVGIVEGGPGSGKTTTLAGIAVAYAYSGCPVLLFAPTVPQAKALGQAVTKVLNLTQGAAWDDHSGPWARRFKIVKLFPGEMDLEGVYSDPEEFAEMMEEADIVIALPYAICSKALVNYFGAQSEKFVVIHDDAHQLTESEIWGTIFGLSARENCRGLIMSSDVKEWPLDIATLAPLEQKCIIEEHKHYQQGYQWMFSTYLKCKEENRNLPRSFQARGACEFEYSGGVNEFADQTGLALVSRLLRQGFPSVMLKDQHRLKAALTEMPNKLVYKTNPLGSVPTPLHAPDITRFHDLLRNWLGVRLGARTKGKDMNHRGKALNTDDIKIVTQYKDQARLYDLEFENRAKESGISKQNLPKAVTLDTLRGHQAKVIIYDLVVTCGDKEHGLGIVNNELRACLAATRATDTLIIIGSRELVTAFPEFWSWMNRRTGAFDNPLPLIVRYAKSLRDDGLSFEPPTETRKKCAFPLKKEWFKKDDGFLAWEWNRNNTSGARE